jgi:hypothetical protein
MKLVKNAMSFKAVYTDSKNFSLSVTNNGGSAKLRDESDTSYTFVGVRVVLHFRKLQNLERFKVSTAVAAMNVAF